MKNTVSQMLTLATLCVVVAHAGERPRLSKDALDAFAYGAKIKVGLHVTDAIGEPVDGVMIDAGFSQEANGKIKDYYGKTDAEGNWSIDAKCSSIANIRLRKDGHYETRLAKQLFSVDFADVNNRIKDGRWIPWIQTVVLKEKRNPTPMFWISSGRRVFPMDEPVGFDFAIGDLVAPLGRGTVADATLHIVSKFQPDENLKRADQLRVVVNSEDGGFITSRRDRDSQMKSVYAAPTNGFAQTSVYPRNRDRSGSGMMYDMAMKEDEYVVFRIRVEKDQKGRIIKSQYGKIYEMRFGDNRKDGQNGYISLIYFLNPTDNDTNLEWDGTDLTTGHKYDVEKFIGPL